MEKHTHHCGVHSAFGVVVSGNPEPARSDDQHHDAWRSGAGRWDPGGRCHGDKRKRPPSSGTTVKTGRWNPQRRRLNRIVVNAFNFVYLNCLVPDIFAVTTSALSLC